MHRSLHRRTAGAAAILTLSSPSSPRTVPGAADRSAGTPGLPWEFGRVGDPQGKTPVTVCDVGTMRRPDPLDPHPTWTFARSSRRLNFELGNDPAFEPACFAGVVALTP